MFASPLTYIIYTLITLLSLLPVRPLGVPCADKSWYARNIWDMTIYDARLFVGCGDAVANAGPIDVWTYQEKIGWRSEYAVDEEQITHIGVIDGILTIPGTDSRDGWDYGNWYERIDGSWVKHRNIPRGIHVFDLVKYHGLLFAALGTNLSGTAVAVSADQGQSWQPIHVPQGAFPFDEEPRGPCTIGQSPRAFSETYAVYAFLIIDDVLYANTGPISAGDCQDGQWTYTRVGHRILRWDGSGFVGTQFDPFAGGSGISIANPVILDEQTAYIAESSATGHLIPVDLISVGADLQAQHLTPENCARPQDIDALNGALYVLCNEETDDHWLVSVQRSCDLSSWNDVTEFIAPTFARSFAISPVDLYVSLGADTDAGNTATTLAGQVLRRSVSLTDGCLSG